MTEQHTIELPDGRTVGFADYGASDATAVLWCHGAPGSRLEPGYLAPAAADAGLRLVGIDRPGYGLSSPQPGRTIAGWVPDALAVTEALEIVNFVTVGVSTGGAYALALAALAPERVLGVVACCAMTDMRWPEGRSTMSAPHTHAVWDAPDRAGALTAAVEAFGEDGSKMLQIGEAPLAVSDLAMFRDREWTAAMMTAMPAMFTHGVEGYADDRLADGPGWVTFDVGLIAAPVIVLHGGSDIIVAAAHAHHTAAIVPTAELRVVPELGHFSIISELLPAILRVLTRHAAGN